MPSQPKERRVTFFMSRLNMVSTEKDLEEDWTQLPQDLNLHKIKLKFI